MTRFIAWTFAALGLVAGSPAAAECPYAKPGGAGDAYVRSQFGKHIGRSTRVARTPRELEDRSHLSAGYGKHLGSGHSKRNW